MSKSSTTTTQQTQQTSGPEQKWYDENNSLFNNYKTAMNNQQPVYQPNALGFNNVQTQAQNMALNIGNSGTSPWYTGAGDVYKNLSNYNAQMVTPTSIGAASATAQGYDPSQAQAASINRKSIQNVAYDPAQAAQVDRSMIQNVNAPTSQAAQMNGQGLTNYVQMMDPSYQNAVLDQASKDIDRQRQMSINSGAANAAAAGAFGGSRHGVADSETNRAYGDTFARTVADMRLQGYQQALQNYQQDLARQQNTGQFNAANQLQAQGMNQNANLQAALQNASMAQQAGLANSENSLRAGMSNQQADLATAQQNAQMAQQAALANAGYRNAASEFGANAQNNVNQFNAGLLQNTNQFNAGQSLQAGIANQGADLNAANMRMNAGENMMNLGSNLFNQDVAKMGLIAGVGDQRYNLDSTNQGIDYANKQLEQQFPSMIAGNLMNAHNGLQSQNFSNSNSTQTTVQRPSLMSTIGQGLSLGANFIPGMGAFRGMTKGLLGGGGAPAVGQNMASLPLNQQQWAGNPVYGSFDNSGNRFYNAMNQYYPPRYY